MALFQNCRIRRPGPLVVSHGPACPLHFGVVNRNLSPSLDELRKTKTDSRLDQAEFSQPLCTAVQIALVNLLRRWNISPSHVIGHSSGELAAAYASGAITAAEAIIAAFYRGLVTKKQIRPGAMAAVGFGREDVASYLTDGVTIACENSPESTTLSGDADKIDVVIGKIKESNPDVLARRLRVEMAYHSCEWDLNLLRNSETNICYKITWQRLAPSTRHFLSHMSPAPVQRSRSTRPSLGK